MSRRGTLVGAVAGAALIVRCSRTASDDATTCLGRRALHSHAMTFCLPQNNLKTHPFLCAAQAAQDARAASKLKDVVDGGVTVLVPSSTTDSFSPAEKKVKFAFLRRLLLLLRLILQKGIGL